MWEVKSRRMKRKMPSILNKRMKKRLKKEGMDVLKNVLHR
jgi:hypothetical protein